MESPVDRLRGFGIEVVRDQPISALTTLRIGGPARYHITVFTQDQVRTALEWCGRSGEHACVIGAGSNILASDDGFAGALVRLRGDFERCSFDGDRVTVGGAVMLTRLINEAAARSLAGLESLIGIPATVGGALAMNAGAHGVWISDRLEHVQVMRIDRPGVGEETLPRDALQFGYRTSGLAGCVVIGAVFRLSPDAPDRIRQRMDEVRWHRARTQPVGTFNAGCVFKNPSPDMPAGRLIEQAGLKGFRIGAARVSERHANFIINEGGATAVEYLQVMQHVVRTVRRHCGVSLEPELRLLGNF
jgi:UDP-N-acetylmuramate dehydrogenase